MKVPLFRRGLTLVAALVLGLVLAGCSTLDRTVDAVRPAGVRGGQYELAAEFDDALNLPRGAPVKVNGLPVGEVVEVLPADYRARVRMAIRDGVEIPAGSRFRLRYTTALGELYVEVTPDGTGRPLAAGAVVDPADALTAPTVEDALGSASLLINGGNLGQVQTIVHELNLALEGRVGTTRGLLRETDRFLVEALASTREIDRVLDALASSSRVLARRQRTINRALRDFRPAAKVLTDNTADLVELLDSTDAMAVTADRLVRRTRDDLVVVVDELGPVLEEVLGLEPELAEGLDQVNALARGLDAVAPGDYLNLRLDLAVDSVLGSSLDAPPTPSERASVR